MIQKLRGKFIVLVVTTLLLMFLVRIVATNWLYYRDFTHDADMILNVLQAEAECTSQSEKDVTRYSKIAEQLDLSPEVFFESRYFVVHVGDNQQVKEVCLDNIITVDEAEASRLTTSTLAKNKRHGYNGDFRYCVCEDDSETTLFFLDRGRELQLFWRNIHIQVVITLGGLIFVFILLLFFSRIILRPVEESYAKQKQFIAVAGHELKTPITIIDADSELLRMELPEGNEWLDDISVQTKRLANLTNDLISLAKLEEVHAGLTKIEFPLSDVISETVQSFRAIAEQQKIVIESQIEPMISYVGDEKLIRQLVGLIVDNALKYTDKSETITVCLEKKPKEIIFKVANKTEWTVHKDISKVFDRFYRSDSASHSITKGYGLGLAIAKQIIESHEGKISAAMPREKIFEITVSLPMKFY